jgi:hypothetical protein
MTTRLPVSALTAVLAVAAMRIAGLQAPGGQDAAPRACLLDSVSWSEPRRFALPGRLREVSGLARLDRTRLLAHDDESGIIFRIGARNGQPAGQFALGPRVPRDDFEGIAVLGNRVYLAASGGRLYESEVGGAGTTVTYRVRDTGLGRQCEIEGLAADSSTRSLLLSCKDPRTPALRGQVTVFAWSVDRAVLEGARVRAPVTAFRTGRVRSFRPSAVEVLPGGDLLILSGADHVLAVVTPRGLVRCTRRLAAFHRQPEGLALLHDGSVVIADEGVGGPARLTLYPRRAR